MQGQAASGDVANDRDGVFVVLAAAVSCKRFPPDVDQAVLMHAVDDSVAYEAPLADFAQEVLEEGSGHLWAELIGS